MIYNLKIIIIKILIVLVLFISFSFLIKNEDIYNYIYKNVFDTNIKFAKNKYLYNKYLGNVLAFDNYIKEEKVFNETLEYTAKSNYNKGVKLTVKNNYLVPAIKEGIVVFIGKKDGLNTIIVEQSDSIDTVYQNFSNINVSLYDYVKDNQILGEVKNNSLYLTFKKDGVEVDYKKIIK